MSDLVSNCCGAPPLEPYEVIDNVGYCSDCHEACSFEEEYDEQDDVMGVANDILTDIDI